MLVLGIETSCDETSVAVVRDGYEVLSLETATSLNFHKRYGGIIPEIASRKQLETITYAAAAALKDAGVSLKDIGLLAITHTPGLLGSLLVGVCFAKSAAYALGKPLLGVNHLHSHIYANFLNAKGPKLPFIALVVSGGHTSLFQVRDFNDIRTLGQTQDDAAGEVFDKVAKILDLGYPGGPFIEKVARRGKPVIRFACSNTKNELDFSFSGIKTAVLYHWQKIPASKRAGALADTCASFQEAVINALIRKALAACIKSRIKRLVVGGGVAANGRLKERFEAEASLAGVEIFFPPKSLCTDNAAMVAGMGYRLYKKGERSNLDLCALMS